MKISTLSLYFVFCASLWSGRAHAQNEIVMIANPNMKIQAISKADVRRIFTGAASSITYGPHARPVLLNAGELNNHFLAEYIGVGEAEFRSDWRSQVFSGQIAMPPSFDTEAEAVDYVAHHIFTLGFIRKNTPHPGVTVLTLK